VPKLPTISTKSASIMVVNCALFFVKSPTTTPKCTIKSASTTSKFPTTSTKPACTTHKVCNTSTELYITIVLKLETIIMNLSIAVPKLHTSSTKSASFNVCKVAQHYLEVSYWCTTVVHHLL
jgi:hypothetical protein